MFWVVVLLLTAEAAVVMVVVAASLALNRDPPCNEMANGRAERAHKLAAPLLPRPARYRYGRFDLLFRWDGIRENSYGNIS